MIERRNLILHGLDRPDIHRPNLGLDNQCITSPKADRTSPKADRTSLKADNTPIFRLGLGTKQQPRREAASTKIEFQSVATAVWNINISDTSHNSNIASIEVGSRIDIPVNWDLNIPIGSNNNATGITEIDRLVDKPTDDGNAR